MLRVTVIKRVSFFIICAKLKMAFTFTSLPLILYTSVSRCGCGLRFEQKFWRIGGFGEKRYGLARRMSIPLFTLLLGLSL